MLKLVVTTCNGKPLPGPIAAEFSEEGGNIGRSSGSTLVLPDPQRIISRTHAIVFFRAGLYLIKDVGTSSPVFVNAWQLGTGQEAPIGNGDEIRIAGYSIKVTVDKTQPTPAPTPRTQPTPAPSPRVDVPAAVPSGSAKDDPLAAFGGGAPSADPFADLIPTPQHIPEQESFAASPSVPPVAPVVHPPAVAQPAPLARSVPTSPPARVIPIPSAPSAASTHSAPSAIPEDFDPFENATPAARPAPARLPDDLDLGLGPIGHNEKIDDLYGLAPGAGHNDPFKSDAPLGESLGGGDPSLDPLVAMGLVPATKPAPLQPQRDNTPEISGSYRFPTAVFDNPVEEPHVERVPEPVARDRAPEGTQSAIPAAFDEEATAEMPMADPVPEVESAPVHKAPAPVEPPPLPVRAAAPVPPPAPKIEPPPPHVQPVQASAHDRPATVAHASTSSTDELLKAYLRGAGVPDVEVPGGLTPELMQVLGQLLRESTQGTVDLLYARAMAKRQLRAEMTMIVARENNPLKFSPTVEGALTHLLAPQRGFMTPVRAIKDAYNDLRSHEVGFVAGMRAALSGVLARFNPTTLEKRLTSKSVLDSLLPMHRQARLWALFEELYTEISAEAEDNFQSLFGREFMRAYEEQVAKLEHEERAANR